MCPLRAIASRTALLRVRSVLEVLGFPKVSHMICQLLPASAPMSTRPRSLAPAAATYGVQDISSKKVLASLPPAGKPPLRTRVRKVSCSSVPCLIHALPKFPKSFQWVLPRVCSLRAMAIRTAPLWARSVLEDLSFPTVSHMIGQLLPAYAPTSTRPHSLALAAIMYGRQFREAFGQFASCWQVHASWQHEFP